MTQKFLISLIGSALASCLIAVAAADAARSVDAAGNTQPTAEQVDQNLQQIKEESINIKADLQSIEQSLLYPDTSRVTIYFGVPVPGLLVQNVVVSVDNGKPLQYKYNNLEAIALQRRGIQPLIKLNAPAGSHFIRADAIAVFADEPNGPQVRGHIEASFTKQPRTPAYVELSLSRDSVVSRPALRMHEWVAQK